MTNTATNNQLIKLETPELNLVEVSKAQQIRAAFEPMVIMLQEFEDQYREIISESKKGITSELTMRAKRTRLDIGKVRIETGKLKDQQKESLKREDRAIMAVHNILAWAVTDKEKHLKEIENHFEIQEQKRLDALQAERVEMLSPYVEDAHERKLCDMEEDVWQAYIFAKRREHDDRLEAERIAERKRVEREKIEAAEREKVRTENERLKKEAAEREKTAKAESDKVAKLEAALRAKEAEEQKVRNKAYAKAEAELNKGDSAKVKDLIRDLMILKTKYQFKSAKNQRTYKNVCVLIDKVIDYINS